MYQWLLLSILTLCTTSGCGSDAPEHTVFIPTLQLGGYESYVEAFVQDAHSHGLALKIRDLIIETREHVDTTPDDGLTTLAICRQGYLMTPKIIVSSVQWETLTEYGRVQLMYHELGHCVLNRDHRVGNSIMNPTKLPDSMFVKYRAELVEELFLKGPIKIPSHLNLVPHTNNQHTCEYQHD